MDERFSDPQQPAQQSVVNLEVVNSDHAEVSTSISDSQQMREDNNNT